jgi:cysteinyl-tRNA synthetase
MVSLKLKNTFTGQIEPFEPLDPAKQRVTLYSCGPTVYSFAHIGNFRSFLFADVLRRHLERFGYTVRHVMNITDVGHMTEDHLADATGEDKLAKAARELGSDPYKVAAHFEHLFVEDATALRMKLYQGAEALDPAQHPRATRHVPEMLAMIQTLIERGNAYVDNAGQVYFEVASFPDYGKLSGKVLEELNVGERVAVREEKKDPRDFALWKVDPKHLMQWDPKSENGWPEGDYARFKTLCPKGIDARIRPGFPGWHIECSAMSRTHLSSEIDIHTGGEDNIFPHHECEIAQSQCSLPSAVAKGTFARFWVHGRHLLVNDKKMSKRDGTFFTARDLFDPAANGRADVAQKLAELGFAGGRVAPQVLRYALISNAYVQPMNFTFALLVQSRSSVERLQRGYEWLTERMQLADGPVSPRVTSLLEETNRAFDEAMGDNLNTPSARAAVFRLVTESIALELNASEARETLRVLEGFDSVLDVLDKRVRSGLITKAQLEQMVGSLDTASLPQDGALDPDAIARLVATRLAAKNAKDYARADALREELKRRGITIEDTAQGVRWKRHE